jgi:ABC-type phosphate transport system substrate-binding protein
MKIMTQFIALILCLGACHTSDARQAVVVVANIDSEITLSKQEIRNLFMGGNVNYDLTAVELPPENDLRILFNTKVVGLTEARIQSYWAQMRFSGRKTPPKQLDDIATVVEYLNKNKGAIAYLPADTELSKDLKVVYKVD